MISEPPSSSSSPPASRTCCATRPPGSIRSLPSTVARSAPGLTRAGSARPPNISPRPVTTIVLPASVSPVTTVNPDESSRTASSITPRPVMRTSSSTGVLLSDRPGALPVRPPPGGGPPAPAGHREAELGDQPVGEQRPAALFATVAEQPGQQDRPGTAAHFDPRSRREIDTTP